MSLRRTILSAILCSNCCLVQAISVTLAQEKNEATAQELSASSEAKTSNYDIAQKAANQIIEQFRNAHDSESVAALDDIRNNCPDTNGIEYMARVGVHSCKQIQYYLDRNELLSAQRLVAPTLQIAQAVKEAYPSFVVAARLCAASVDLDFEFYDSALKHLTVARQAAEEVNMDEHKKLVVRLHYATALQKLKRFDEAEKIVTDSIQQIKNDPDKFFKSDLLNAQFALAALYSSKGDLDRYFTALPDEGKKRQGDEDDRTFGYRLLLMHATVVDYSLSKGYLDVAEYKASRTVEGTQITFGVSSLEHIEAIEMLAKVRVAQKDIDEAVALYKKSADLRAGLLGKDHVSISRLHKEIDAIRKKQLDTAEPIWKPVDNGDEVQTADRYKSKKPDDARK